MQIFSFFFLIVHFFRCYFHTLTARPNDDDAQRDPCAPSPCGSFSYCRNINGSPACTCQEGYLGQPPNCRPECTIHSECPGNEACINEKCRDPCLGACGAESRCSVLNHIPSCSCPDGYEGNPFQHCSPIRRKKNFIFFCFSQFFHQPIINAEKNPVKIMEKQNRLVQIQLFFFATHHVRFFHFIVYPGPEAPKDKCNPSPCGSNAICEDGSCTCMPEFQGNPYAGCRPECVLNTDCPRDRACLRNKCNDPCPDACAANAQCTVINHVPMCSCPPGMTGNAFSLCTPVQGMRSSSDIFLFLFFLYNEK